MQWQLQPIPIHSLSPDPDQQRSDLSSRPRIPHPLHPQDNPTNQSAYLEPLGLHIRRCFPDHHPLNSPHAIQPEIHTPAKAHAPQETHPLEYETAHPLGASVSVGPPLLQSRYGAVGQSGSDQGARWTESVRICPESCGGIHRSLWRAGRFSCGCGRELLLLLSLGSVSSVEETVSRTHEVRA